MLQRHNVTQYACKNNEQCVRAEDGMKSVEWQGINFICRTKGLRILLATEGDTINFVSEN